MTKKRNIRLVIILLSLLALIGAATYLFAFVQLPFDLAFKIRGPKLVSFLLVALATGAATLVFQTLTHNRLLTPNVIGMDAMYLLFQILAIFLFSSQSPVNANPVVNFTTNTLAVVGLSLLVFVYFYRHFPKNVPLMLLFGLVLGILINSLNNFLQVIMNPDEYSIVLSRSLVSFGQINQSVLIIAGLLCIPVLLYLYSKCRELDVLSLGDDYAENLGIQVGKRQLIYFILVAVLTSASAALVGPVSFLGFLGVNIAYSLVKTHHHHELFILTSLVIFVFVVFGQTLVDQVFNSEINLGILIEFIGGIYFLAILLKGRKNR